MLLSLGVGLGTGCGVDLAADEASPEDGDPSNAGTSGGVGDSEQTGPAGGESTDGAQTGFDTDTSSGDTGEFPPAETDDDVAECNLDCGEEGWCEDFGDGPTCACPDGFVSTGLDCLKCEEVTDGDLPADVPTVQGRFSFLVNGQPPPTSPFNSGTVSLKNRTTSDVVVLGRTHTAAVSKLLVPGTYDAFFSHDQGTQGIPLNEDAKIATLEVDEDNLDHVVDVQVATITGSFSIGGTQLPDAAFNYGRIWLVNPKTGDRALLGDTRTEAFTADVVPGSYEVRYESRASSGGAPLNTDGLIRELRVKKAGEVIQRETIDVPVTHYTGQLLINGEAVGTSFESANIELHDLATGALFQLGRTQDTAFDVAVIPGSYELIYKSVQGGAVAPVNTHHVLRVLELEPGAVNGDIDIPSASFSGAFALDGQPPPLSNSDDGIVLLRGLSGEDTAVLGNTHDVTFNRQVIPGDYDVFYAQETAGGVMPGNTNAMLPGSLSVPDTGAENTSIDVPVVELSGELTIGGAAAPDSPYDDGRLYLRDPATGDSVLLGNTRLGTYAARVVPGTYDIVYEAEFSDGVMPVNRGAVVEAGVVFEQSGQRDINIEVTSLTGDITIDGASTQSAEGLGQLYLRDIVANDLVYLGHTGAPGFEQPLLGGRYVAEYHGVPSEGATLGETLPANERAAFACFDIGTDE